MRGLRLGDASRKFVYAKLESRRRKNFIHSIQHQGQVMLTHEDKAKVIDNHFAAILGVRVPHGRKLDWQQMQIPGCQLLGLTILSLKTRSGLQSRIRR